MQQINRYGVDTGWMDCTRTDDDPGRYRGFPDVSGSEPRFHTVVRNGRDPRDSWCSDRRIREVLFRFGQVSRYSIPSSDVD